MHHHKPHKNMIRLYMPAVSFGAGAVCDLAEGQVHYLRNVMRLEAGAELRVFNGADGEWLAVLSDIGKKKGAVTLQSQLRPQVSSPDIHVLASPIKKENFDLMIEKSSELGAASFTPVICGNTVVHKINAERMGAHAIEAAEQCERLDVLKIDPLCDLMAVLKLWPPEQKLIACIERHDAPRIDDALNSLGRLPVALLVGPEGGFTPEEVAHLTSCPFVVPVSLGPRILRAETALISALSVIQARIGDW